MKLIGRKTVKTSKTSAPLEVKIPAAPAAAATPPYDVIARRAYELYLARGAEPGHDAEDWLRAERELRAS
jgi:hypothetical protein